MSSFKPCCCWECPSINFMGIICLSLIWDTDVGCLSHIWDSVCVCVYEIFRQRLVCLFGLCSSCRQKQSQTTAAARCRKKTTKRLFSCKMPFFPPKNSTSLKLLLLQKINQLHFFFPEIRFMEENCKNKKWDALSRIYEIWSCDFNKIYYNSTFPIKRIFQLNIIFFLAIPKQQQTLEVSVHC